MTGRRRNKLIARQARLLRWWLTHHAGCVMCTGLETLEGRLEFARDEVECYREKTPENLRRPVRVPRRFWPALGRVVT